MSEDLQGVEMASHVEAAGRRPGKARAAVLVACAVVLLAALGVLAAFATGTAAPPGAAAKYNLLDYIAEDDVSDYIATYKGQMVGADASDADWATFLAAYNLTPERLRQSTIDQLATDAVARERCRQLGIDVSAEEVDEAVEGYKAQYASGSDTIWSETLAQVGQTEEGFREGLELTLLKQKLAEHEVPEPTPTDDQVKSTVATYIDGAKSNERSLLLKHSYCFRKAISSEENSFSEGEEVEKIRKQLVEDGATVENFAAIVAQYADDGELKDNGGANGWDADTSGYSETYVKALETVNSVGDVSSVFTDDDCHFFIMVSDVYELPEESSKASDLDLDEMPDSLRAYFEDLTAYGLRQSDEQEYLAGLTKGLDVKVFDMPADVPYNVDMSLAQSDDGAAAGDEEG